MGGLGADFVLTGTINQMSAQAGTCDTVRKMLSGRLFLPEVSPPSNVGIGVFEPISGRLFLPEVPPPPNVGIGVFENVSSRLFLPEVSQPPTATAL